MKKIDSAAQFLTEQMDLFQCPVCRQAFQQVENRSLRCESGHLFDLSKKGTLYFLLKGSKNEYDKEMLTARFQIAQAGLFDPLLDSVYQHIQNKETGHLLDVGCGEGSQLDYLTKLGLKGQKIGFDISKDAIQLAASHFTSAFWCVADLAQSPFATNQYDTILNIFSPSNYQEFERLLKPGGQVLKVVPEKDYLMELRALFYRDQKERQDYSNELVIKKFKEHFSSIETKRVRYQFPLTDDAFKNLMKMTPLSWGASEAAKQYALEHPLSHITVDVCLLIGSD
ncbi:MAG: methyltransferase domain-containing protein [Carnobacterium sp.]|uniref:methyltransferase domain-containing protein n=1 Tax=Carnobacterium sp. TaxID=48221 RepID=UPI002FC8FC7D